MLEATCHCGAVRIGMARRPRSLTQCTCSICRRYGALWAYCTRKTASVLTDASEETAYSWNDRVIEFYHCNTCGCITRYESVDKFEHSRIAVNARMLCAEDIRKVRIRTFDGAATWRYLD